VSNSEGYRVEYEWRCELKTMPSVSRVTKKPKAEKRDLRWRFTVEEYHRLEELGFFAGRPRCELLNGCIVEKPKMNPPHKTTLRNLYDLLRPIIPAEYLFDSQAPITLSDSEPEPDFSITLGPGTRYAERHAGPDEVLLVVEIADSSLPMDTGEKLQLYAEAGIPQYWVVNLQARLVTVYTRPRGGRSPTYRTHHDYAIGSEVPVVIGKKTLGSIPVREILP
jgi:Uma2 family endonuclease